MADPNYIPGDYWIICETCGFQVRSSAARKRWDGLLVCDADWEPRHPQDFVRGRADHQNVPEPAPEPVQNFLGPLTTELTAAASAGATTLAVVSSVRFDATDRLGVMLSSGEMAQAVVSTVPTATSLTISPALPGAALLGAMVINYSAVAEADVG